MAPKKRTASLAAADGEGPSAAAVAPATKKHKKVETPARRGAEESIPGPATTDEEETAIVKSSTPKPRRSARVSNKDSAVVVDDKAPPKPGAVIYIGHIPHGFYEEQMRGFFSQFGVVTRVRLSRSKKTGRSKHFAFVEFKYPEVAEIAAESMNKYLMFGKILVAHVMPQKDLHDQMFVGCNRAFVKVPMGKVAREKRERERTTDEQEVRVKNLTKKDRARRKKFEAMGLDFEFDGYAAKIPAKPAHKKF
mmetsp:Transcript_26205/g.49786  ORF Transcript_26205/g.49786 Transcript_26205/m.49786 type:complete len:250 (-) Transcript_26205:2203-2952(-)|eukprot:CAMPEP_0114312280 /NCGR_PEP_ID=MMETSP0059-20121206/20337_1 /TAXON_ID=36894 /ORGANISM="Pyramimonas parkeae, Strain CCMP726" /LENGTH=249 /DNA_ID=CAMNT_0001436637 /DNA_START=100 /DNA_END=849 /DNA_ORIENTATION=-